MVGLTLFVGLLLIALHKTFQTWSRVRKTNLDHALMGASLFACMVGTVVYIFTTGFYPIHYILIGLMLTYAQLKVVAVAPDNPVRTQVALPGRHPMAPIMGRAAGSRAAPRRPF
jgi:hypothetical protein